MMMEDLFGVFVFLGSPSGGGETPVERSMWYRPFPFENGYFSYSKKKSPSVPNAMNTAAPEGTPSGGFSKEN